MAREFARGVVLVRKHEAWSLAFGESRELGVTGFAPGRFSRPRIAVTVFHSSTPTNGSDRRDAGAPAESSASLQIALEHGEIDVPGQRTLVFPGSRFDGTVRFEKLELRRGGAAHLLVEGAVGSAPTAYRMKAAIRTFIRDVVDGSAD
jgi:hypothetical protein